MPSRPVDSFLLPPRFLAGLPWVSRLRKSRQQYELSRFCSQRVYIFGVTNYADNDTLAAQERGSTQIRKVRSVRPPFDCDVFNLFSFFFLLIPHRGYRPLLFPEYTLMSVINIGVRAMVIIFFGDTRI